jgi:hypothetical protein
MSVESQKSMAFEGLLGWAEGVAAQAQALSLAQDKITKPLQEEIRVGGWRNHVEVMQRVRANKHTFDCQRHYFVLAANKLVEYRRWAGRLGLAENTIFFELDSQEKAISELRDMNEHVIDYFRGKGKKRDRWFHSDAGGTADASATVGKLIGGRLDWVELGKVASRLLKQLYQIDAELMAKRAENRLGSMNANRRAGSISTPRTLR